MEFYSREVLSAPNPQLQVLMYIQNLFTTFPDKFGVIPAGTVDKSMIAAYTRFVIPSGQIFSLTIFSDVDKISHADSLYLVKYAIGGKPNLNEYHLEVRRGKLITALYNERHTLKHPSTTYISNNFEDHQPTLLYDRFPDALMPVNEVIDVLGSNPDLTFPDHLRERYNLQPLGQFLRQN